MTRKDIEGAVEGFRHAIVYLIHEAKRSGLIRLGASLKLAEKSIDEEIKLLSPPNEAPPEDTDRIRHNKSGQRKRSGIDD